MHKALEEEEEDIDDLLSPLVLSTRSMKMDDKGFYQFCRENADLRIERTATGDIEIMAPTGGWTGNGNAELTTEFTLWARGDGTGVVFDSSTVFQLPNNASRSPDVAWVLKSRLKALGRKNWKKFPPLCPDFVLELRSPSDRLPTLHAKMVEYLENGARLGWLINPPRREVFIYRPGKTPEHLLEPESLGGETVLPGFVLQLARIWRAVEGELD